MSALCSMLPFAEFLLNCRHGNIAMSHGHDGVEEQIRHLVYECLASL